MHKLIAGVTILEHELSELRLLVERQTGVLLDCPNSALAAHIAEYLEAHELESPGSLLDRLRACDLDPAQMADFLDGVLNVHQPDHIQGQRQADRVVLDDAHLVAADGMGR